MFRPVSRLVHKRVLLSNVVSIRGITVPLNRETGNSFLASKLAGWMKHYEDVIGLTEVKEAQNRVISAEKKFLDTQELRRERQIQLQQLQVKLKDIHVELDKTLRGDDRYLELVTQEHALMKDDRRLTEEFQFYEKSERDYFSSLSNALRDSHERERSYVEKTKYWSIIGSVLGAIIGILGTSVNNHVRLRELKNLVKDSVTASSSSAPVLRELISKTADDLKRETVIVTQTLKEVREALKDNHLTVNVSSKKQLPDDTFGKTILAELTGMKALLKASQLADGLLDGEGGSQRGAVIYLGRDVEHLVRDAQHNLEWKIKVNSLATVALIYGGVAVTIPILYKIFGGGA